MPIKISFVGNLGRDAELKQFENGDTACNFTVAAKAKFGKDDPPVWMACRLVGTRAEKIHSLLTKGTGVTVWGRFEPREYETKQGEKRVSYDVRVEDVEITRGRDGGRADGGGAGGSGGNSAPVSIDEARRILDEPDTDGIPF